MTEQRFYAVYDVATRMVQYPKYHDGDGDVAAVYTSFKDAHKRRREFAAQNPHFRFVVREVSLVPVRKPKRSPLTAGTR